VKGLMTIVALSVGLPWTCSAYDRYSPAYGPSYRNYSYSSRPHVELEISRIRRDLRNQKFSDSLARRRHEQELSLLRQQATSSNQVSADQACYYRSTGGFELCADLYAVDAAEFSACESLVVQRNPGCNKQPLLNAGER
jgi:hypothetical protein